MSDTLAIEAKNLANSKRRSILSRYATALLFLLPFLLAFILFFVVPLIYGVQLSLSNVKFSKPNEATFNNFQWFRAIFGASSIPASKQLTPNFWKSFANSFIFSVIMVPVAILLPLGLAILVNSKPVGYKVFRAMIYLPSIVPLSAAGTIFNLLFLSKNQHGLINEFFNLNINWLTDIWFKFNIGSYVVEVPYGWIPIFLMCLWGGWGSNFIIFSAGLQNVPKSLYEAASIDGCSTMKKIKAVTLPGIKGQMVLCLFTTIIGYLGLYGQNYVLTQSGPGATAMPGSGKTATVIYFIQDIVANNPDFKENLYGLGCAAALVFAILVGIISGIQMYVTRDKKPGSRNSEAFEKWQRIR